MSRISFTVNRYPQEALQNGGIGVDTTPVVTTILYQLRYPSSEYFFFLICKNPLEHKIHANNKQEFKTKSLTEIQRPISNLCLK